MTVRFFALTFFATWTFWAAAAATDGVARSALTLLGVFMPAVIALSLSDRATLLERLTVVKTSPWLYVFVIAYMPAAKLFVAVVHFALFDVWPRWGTESVALMIAATAFSTPIQAGEEIGWRGFALPRLAARFGMAAATVVLGVIWASWHLPLFFMPGSTTYGQSFAVYLVQVTAISVAIGWVYRRSGSSLLLPMLMHAAINNFKDIVPSFDAPRVAWLTAAVMWVFAAPLLVALALDDRSPRAARGPEATRGAAA
jgi:membrane protease YdiL (CAAX protease family)